MVQVGGGQNVVVPSQVGPRRVNWPANFPTWFKTELETLAAGHQLAIPPTQLAPVQWQSGFAPKVTGAAAVNSSGYGGYFGLHYATPSGAGSYRGPTGNTFSVTLTTLRTGGVQSYRNQAIVASKAYAGYEEQTHTTILGAYAKGTSSGGAVSEANIYRSTVQGGPKSTTPKYPFQNPITPKTGKPTKGAAIAGEGVSNAVLAALTNFLNPSNTTTGLKGFLVGDVASALKLIAFRGVGFVIFGVVLGYGIHLIIRGPSQRSTVIGSYIRLGQASRRLDIASYEAETRRTPPVRQYLTQRATTIIHKVER